jgi:SAM-dependent methyltransferase
LLLQAASGTPCEFVLADICQIPQQFYQSYDVVYISVGVLGWITDLGKLFWNVRKVLQRGGRLAIYEMHPALDMFLQNDASDPPPLTYSYFETRPRLSREGLDYITGKSYSSPPYYWFHHKISDIFNSIITNGLNVVYFHELDYDISSVYTTFNNISTKPPMSYTLLARLPAP